MRRRKYMGHLKAKNQTGGLSTDYTFIPTNLACYKHLFSSWTFTNILRLFCKKRTTSSNDMAS